MHFYEVLLYCLLAFIALQIIAVCYTRLDASFTLIDPRIKSKKNLRGYYAIVTGSNSGIGYEIAKYLAAHGAYVVLACRSNERGKKAEESINNYIKLNTIYKGGKAEYIQCDLSKLHSTKTFIQQYKDKKYPLHILINNAGLGGRYKAKFTQDGFDIVWQVNYLAHFLLTYELLPIIMASYKINDTCYECRIVNTSSSWHRYGYLDFDTLKSDRHTQAKRYKGVRSGYGRSKLAQILHATYLQTEVFTQSNIAISICSVHPGGVKSKIWKIDKWNICEKLMLVLFYPVFYFGFRSNEAGSRCNVYCAIAPIGKEMNTWGGEFIPGAYHVNLKPCITSDKEGQSTCPKAMKRLYEYSLDMLKLKRRTKEDYVRLMGVNAKEQ